MATLIKSNPFGKFKVEEVTEPLWQLNGFESEEQYLAACKKQNDVSALQRAMEQSRPTLSEAQKKYFGPGQATAYKVCILHPEPVGPVIYPTMTQARNAMIEMYPGFTRASFEAVMYDNRSQNVSYWCRTNLPWFTKDTCYRIIE